MSFWEIQLKVSHRTCVGPTNVLGAYMTRLRVDGMWKDIRFSLLYFVFQLIGWIVGRRTRMDCAKTSDRFYPVKCTHCAIRETDATHTNRWVMWKRSLFKQNLLAHSSYVQEVLWSLFCQCSMLNSYLSIWNILVHNIQKLKNTCLHTKYISLILLLFQYLGIICICFRTIQIIWVFVFVFVQEW